jgi:RNA polymerase primary sigma factor
MEGKNEGRSGEWVLLKMFQRDVDKYPVLSREDESVIAKQARAGDQAAMDLLVESNLRFVLKVVFQYWHHELPVMDLVSAGCLGMVSASKSYDPDRGCRFITFAERPIKYRVWAAIESHYQHRHDSLDDPVCDDGDKTTFKDRLTSKDPGADEMVSRQQILKMLSCLDNRERKLLLLLFWCDLTLKDAGAKIGVSKDRVHQIANKALRKLRWTRSVDLGRDQWQEGGSEKEAVTTSNMNMEVGG